MGRREEKPESVGHYMINILQDRGFGSRTSYACADAGGGYHEANVPPFDCFSYDLMHKTRDTICNGSYLFLIFGIRSRDML